MAMMFGRSSSGSVIIPDTPSEKGELESDQEGQMEQQIAGDPSTPPLPQHHGTTTMPLVYSPEEESSASSSTTFSVGDHVYIWCSMWGIPGMFQHHGIVLTVDEAKDVITIADFNAI
eukprot:scaffold245402_cov46-Attheya_sp.AAC.1